jgi:hypothetical protein
VELDTSLACAAAMLNNAQSCLKKEQAWEKGWSQESSTGGLGRICYSICDPRIMLQTIADDSSAVTRECLLGGEYGESGESGAPTTPVASAILADMSLESAG